MKSAFLWIITGCVCEWIPSVRLSEQRGGTHLNRGSCHHVPANSKLKTHQHNLLLPPSALLRFICLALHFLFFFWGGGHSCLFVWGFVIDAVTENFYSCTTKRYLSVWVASIKGSYTLRLFNYFVFAFYEKVCVQCYHQQVMIWTLTDSTSHCSPVFTISNIYLER